MKSNDEALSRVEIIPYQPQWPILYQAERRSLCSGLLSLIRDIEHIGSTAVPNLQAKPIIDMMASTDKLEEVQLITEKLILLDYIFIKTGMRNRLLFRKIVKPGGQTYHLHLVGPETWARRKERIMRDYLVSHPTDAAAYGLLKEKLAADYSGDSLGYTKAKTEFIQTIIDKAYRDFGWEPIDVWKE